MSREMIQLIVKLNQEALNTQLALQCAPVLLGIKISNLLILEKEKQQEAVEFFRETELSCQLLGISEKKVTFLIYHRRELADYLKENGVKEQMEEFGYGRCRLEEVLKEFAQRYQGYMKSELEFPHEMGLLLGYPLEDVTGFIRNRGENFLYAGYWKVYANLSAALKLFSDYSKAKEAVVKMIAEGKSISI